MQNSFDFSHILDGREFEFIMGKLIFMDTVIHALPRSEEDFENFPEGEIHIVLGATQSAMIKVISEVCETLKAARVVRGEA